MRATAAFLAAATAFTAEAASRKHWHKRADHLYLPKEVNDYQTASAPNNVTVRYKNPGICETTPGVDSYAGYVDLAPNVCTLHLPQVYSLTQFRFMFSIGSSNRAIIQPRIHSLCG
jgi:hypothetical protein